MLYRPEPDDRGPKVWVGNA